MPFVVKLLWEQLFKGYCITGCTIRNKNIIYICSRGENPDMDGRLDMFDVEIPTRFIALYPYLPEYDHAPEQAFGMTFWNEGGMDHPGVGVALKPTEKGLMFSQNEDGFVLPKGPGENSPEYIDKGHYPWTQKIKCIEGYAWSVGMGRKIYKRTDTGRWNKVDAGFPVIESDTDQGFVDLDAFSEQDMYAVGGQGDVWRYDGHQWNMCGFPSNEQLSTVVCAPDGQVYIGGEGGNLWAGRENTWKRVYEGQSAILWNEMRWFENKLWLASDYMLKVWDGKTLERPMDGDKPVVLSGHIDARDGVLLVAGGHSLDLFDGQEWKSIMKPYE
ncbi:hypothetical protein [Salmonella enterica]|uniref:hypothetical protein n=1 Tax=Salmonella enterica TaxID=28901 RepID=UPI0013E94F85|nr:hypothetical protein [Salmonella enterica]